MKTKKRQELTVLSLLWVFPVGVCLLFFSANQNNEDLSAQFMSVKVIDLHLKEEGNRGEHGKWSAVVLGNFFPDMNNEASRIVLGNIFAIVSMSFDRRREKGIEGKRMKILGNKDRIFQDLKMEPLDNFCCGCLLATNERREQRKTRMKIFENKGRIFQDLTM